MQGQSTVMGPEDSCAPGDFLQAPVFTSITDKYQYRRNVKMWYQFVFTSAEAGHSKAKGIASNLGICLYARMDSKFKRTIDDALDGDVLRFTNEDGMKLNNTEQIYTINQILDIIAKDSPTDHVRRLARLNKAVYMCRRKKGEAFQEYIARFRSLANAYLSHVNASSNGQDEQNFAMMLIENAGLDLSTYNNIIRDLVAQTRDNNIEPTINVKMCKLRAIQEKVTVIKAKSDALCSHSQHMDNESSTSHGIDSSSVGCLGNSIDDLFSGITCSAMTRRPKQEGKEREREVALGVVTQGVVW